MFETDVGDTGEHTGSFFYLSIPYYWVRELLLSFQAKKWQLVEATVESAHRSLGGRNETIRLEVWYSYSFNGQAYSGRLVRDAGFSWGIQTALARYAKGSRVSVNVNPHDPEQSYLPSGLGWVQPLLIAVFFGGTLALLLGIAVQSVLAAILHS